MEDIVPALRVAGEGLISTAEAVYASDYQLIGNVAVKTGDEYAKATAFDIGDNLLAGGSSYLFDKGFTNNDMMVKSWNAVSSASDEASKEIFENLQKFVPDLAEDAFKEGFGDVVEWAGDQLLEKSLGMHRDNLVDYGMGMINKSAKNQAGLNFE